jgi:hypothetical protein
MRKPDYGGHAEFRDTYMDALKLGLWPQGTWRFCLGNLLDGDFGRRGLSGYDRQFDDDH